MDATTFPLQKLYIHLNLFKIHVHVLNNISINKNIAYNIDYNYT